MSTRGVCTIEGCETRSKARGWCNKHWYRWYRNGDPNSRVRLRGEGLETRLWNKVNKTDECWNWSGSVDSSGYGTINFRGKTLAVHRVAYEIFSGEIPANMLVDHICHTRTCVRPEHLRVVTRKQNAENHSGLSKSNTSGHRGVSWNKKNFRWEASVNHEGKLHFLGNYPLYELHVAGYKAMMKRNELFTHNDKDRLL